MLQVKLQDARKRELTTQQLNYSMWQYNVNILFCFCSVFIERFDRSTVARFTYCVGMAAECNDSVGYGEIRHE